MIPIYDVNNITGDLDIMFQNIMRICFIFSIVLLTFWIIASLLIWLFRSQKKIRESNKIWNKKFYNNFNINYFSFNSSNIA
jgi:hypothetical protein